MAKYRRQEGGSWTISSSLMGWGVTGIAVLLVGFFLAGIYVGYGMGIEEGKRRVRQDIKQSGGDTAAVSGQIAKLIEEKNNQSGTSPGSAEQQSGTSPKSGAFTEEDLGFLTEGNDTASGDTKVAQNVDQPPSESTQTTSGNTDQGSGESIYGGNTSSDQPSTESQTTPSQDTTAAEGGESSPYGEMDSADTEKLRTFYTIQTVSFKRKDYAQRAARRLENLGHSVMTNKAMVNGTQYYRVRVGVFPTRSKAQTYAKKMKKRGEIEDFWISQVTREQ